MLLIVKAASERLSVSPSLVYAMVASKRLAAVRIGNGRGTIRIEEAEVERLLAEGRTDARADSRVGGTRLRHITPVGSRE